MSLTLIVKDRFQANNRYLVIELCPIALTLDRTYEAWTWIVDLFFEPLYQDAKHGILFKMCYLADFYHDTPLAK